jgi:glyoxylase-like metal-dependent hydrolase (beta-lactamase superfamily II)/predicted ester cyclase
MTSTADIVRHYFAALSAHDLDAAAECWAPGGIDRLVGAQELTAPHGIKEYFGALLGAFPDFEFEIIELTTSHHRSAVRWIARGTFAGPATFQGFLPNGARMKLEGCDVLTVADDLIQHNDAYIDSGDVARQLGLLPPSGSRAEARLTRLANARTQLMSKIQGGEPVRIADGVWVLRGGFPLKTMNVYLIEDDGQITVFDAGIEAMGPALRVACARFGGAKRVILGHADADHRGAAPALDAPAYCHPAEHEAAQSSDPCRAYWNFDKLDVHGRVLLGRLIPVWDGGAVKIEGTVQEGDEVAGFRVVDLPGHAPGLIGLFRESDRLALVSDCFYTLDPQTGRKGAARVPHPAFDLDVEQARESIRKLADLNPSVAWAGHADPVTGDVASQLRQAASAKL